MKPVGDRATELVRICPCARVCLKVAGVAIAAISDPRRRLFVSRATGNLKNANRCATAVAPFSLIMTIIAVRGGQKAFA